MWLIMTVLALVVVLGLGSFDLWGFDGYRPMLIIFLGIAVLLQATFRARVR
jgi:hypothetical protein